VSRLAKSNAFAAGTALFDEFSMPGSFKGISLTASLASVIGSIEIGNFKIGPVVQARALGSSGRHRGTHDARWRQADKIAILLDGAAPDAIYRGVVS
jgi:hypothetical protein